MCRRIIISVFAHTPVTMAADLPLGHPAIDQQQKALPTNP